MNIYIGLVAIYDLMRQESFCQCNILYALSNLTKGVIFVNDKMLLHSSQLNLLNTNIMIHTKNYSLMILITMAEIETIFLIANL